jgi:predicted nucleic acid-binding protein
MILVDTSVLVDLLRGVTNSSTTKFREIEENHIPYGITPFIYQEILQGANSEKAFQSLREYLSTQTFYYPKDHLTESELAAKIYFKCRKAGITIRSSIDCTIVQTCLTHDLFLLHNDSDFTRIKKVIKELKIY